MGRPVALAVLAVAALVCAAGLVLAFTPLLDGVALGPTLDFTDAMADQFHHGQRPCLRYDWAKPPKFDVELYGKQLVDAGISAHRLGDLAYEFQARKDTREAAAHTRDEVEERLDWAARSGAAQKLLVALKRARLRKLLHRYLDRAIPSRPVAPLNAHEREVIDQISASSPRLLMIDGLLELIKVMKVQETQKKLDALADFVTEKGVLDEQALPPELLEDAWSGRVKVSVEDGAAQFTSLGADGVLGGSAEDADLIATAKISKVAGEVAAPETQPELAAVTGAPPPASVTLPRRDFDDALMHLDQLSTQARIVPSFVSGKAVGFKIFGIRKGSLYQRAGIESGDVVTQINGFPLDSPDKALEMYTKIKDSQRLTLSLLRSGKPYLVSVELK